jgi:hypothetical protein
MRCKIGVRRRLFHPKIIIKKVLNKFQESSYI